MQGRDLFHAEQLHVRIPEQADILLNASVRLGEIDGLPAGNRQHNRYSHRHQDAQQNRNDFGHAFAPNVEDHNGQQGQDGNRPAGLAVIDRTARQAKPNRNDNGACYNGREEFHNPGNAHNLNDSRQHQVQQPGTGHTQAGIRQQFRLRHAVFTGGRRYCCITAQESKRRTQEGRYFPLGDQVEQQRAQPGHQQRGGHIQPRQQGYQHRSPEHGEGVLNAQNQHLRDAKRSGVCDSARVFFAHTLRLLHDRLKPQKKTALAFGLPKTILPFFLKVEKKGKMA